MCTSVSYRILVQGITSKGTQYMYRWGCGMGDGGGGGGVGEEELGLGIGNPIAAPSYSASNTDVVYL